MPDKTVLILGAGFSCGAGLPAQTDILARLRTFGVATKDPRYRLFRKFFFDTIGRKASNYLIEDVFTILDQCLTAGESFRGVEVSDIDEVNRSLLLLLRAYLLDTVSKSISGKSGLHSSYLRLANEILRARDQYGDEDRLSIFSLNWDHYFEKVLTSRLPNHPEVSLDYCTYDYSFTNSGRDLPSILKKANGKRNLKVLKPHGSANWGYCSNCGRLYISYGKKIASKFECIKYCNKKYRSKHIPLSPVLITPTFLKELSIRPLKDIWNNIGIELAEASRLAFVGYSLRPEDYFFRYMLAKHIQPSASIWVFDLETNSVQKSATQNRLLRKYRDFFQRVTDFHVSVDGWENEIASIAALLK